MQKTFSELEYAGKKKQTRRDRFLSEINTLAPWPLLEAQIAPFYCGTTGGRGRPAIGLQRMLRMYVVQQCFGLSDAGAGAGDAAALGGWRFISLCNAFAQPVERVLRGASSYPLGRFSRSWRFAR